MNSSVVATLMLLAAERHVLYGSWELQTVVVFDIRVKDRLMISSTLANVDECVVWLRPIVPYE